MYDYHVIKGGMPKRDAPFEQRAVFTLAYALMPAGVQRDIVTSHLPFWQRMRCWVLARPLSGFAETFSHTVIELEVGGGSERPELIEGVESSLFVVQGKLRLSIDDVPCTLGVGSFAFIPAHCRWQIFNDGGQTASFHWLRKKYQAVQGLEKPDVIIGRDQDIIPQNMPDSDGKWSTTRFIDPTDRRYDMHVTIVTFEPGGRIPFPETHVMEHGLYVLCGQGEYLLNRDWIKVEAGDYMWLRAFCPQACVASGDQPFRYLLYKDMNRHPEFF